MLEKGFEENWDSDDDRVVAVLCHEFSDYNGGIIEFEHEYFILYPVASVGRCLDCYVTVNEVYSFIHMQISISTTSTASTHELRVFIVEAF